MKKIIAFVLTLTVFMTMSASFFSANAADYGCTVDTSSKNVYLENLDTKTIVFEKNADEKTYPASLTKMMTYIVVTENIPDLENTKITVTQEALANLDPQSSVMGLTSHVGQQFSVLDLLRGLMIPSGNDAALVLAHYVGDGNVSNFVDLMNRKAAQLGCKSTHFVNPHGLFDPMHYSTARDLSIIAKYAAVKPYFIEITGTLKYTVDGMTAPIENTNYMIDPAKPQYYYENVACGKTGFTDEAGKCLMSIAKEGEYTYMCIALGSPYSYAEDVNYAMLDSKNLYEWAFDNISVVEVLSTNDVVRSLSVAYVFGDKKVDVMPQKSVEALLPNNYDQSLISTQVQLPPSTKAPLTKGQVLGTINVYYGEDQVGQTNLVSSEDIEVDQLSLFAHNFVDFVSDHIIVIVILISAIIAFVIVSIYRRKQRKKQESRFRYR